METFPLPKWRSSWLAVIINIGLFFSLYYGLFFSYTLKIYQAQFIPGSFEKGKDQLVVWVEYPRYFFSAGADPVYLHIRNESDNSLENVRVYLRTVPADTAIFLLPTIIENDSYTSSLVFPFIEAHSIATGRFSIIAQSRTGIDSIDIRVGNNEPERLGKNSPMNFTESNLKAFQREILGQILLPPWSNIFLVIAVLISAFLIRTDSQSDAKEPDVFIPSRILLNPLWLKAFADDWMKSTFVLAVLIFLSGVFFGLLGFIDRYTIWPILLMMSMFACLIIRNSKKHIRSLDQLIRFLSFLWMVLGAYVLFFVSVALVSFLGKVAWGILAVEGLVVFMWFSRKQSMKNPAVNNHGENQAPASPKNKRNRK